MFILFVMPEMEEGKDYHYFPLGILAIAAAVDKLDFIEYEIYDERVEKKDKFDNLIMKADIVCISIYTGYQTSRGYKLVKECKERNNKVVSILGGPHATALPEQTVQSEYVDYVVSGYAENSFRDLIINIQEYGKKSFNITGLYFKDNENGEIYSNITAKNYKDLTWNELPYYKVDVNNYINPETKRIIYVTQYGCPAKCTFCATPETRKWAEKPVELVTKDLDYLYEKTRFEQLEFFDATLFTRKKRVKEIVDHVANAYNGVMWFADARAAELKNYTVKDLMEINNEKLSLNHLTVGMESGSKRISEDIYKKGRNHLDIFLQTAEKLYKAGIELTSGCILGAPTETEKDLEETIRYIHKVRKAHPRFKMSTTFFRPLPGTDLFEYVKEFGIEYPDSLEGWAKLEGITHYAYNKWQGVPWMDKKTESKYLKMYDILVQEHGDILA